MNESEELLQRRSDGVDDDTVEAVGSLSEALEYVERARGHLYSFHQLIGHADLLLGETCDKLRSAGHGDIADTLATDIAPVTQVVEPCPIRGIRHIPPADSRESRRDQRSRF